LPLGTVLELFGGQAMRTVLALADLSSLRVNSGVGELRYRDTHMVKIEVFSEPKEKPDL